MIGTNALSSLREEYLADEGLSVLGERLLVHSSVHGTPQSGTLGDAPAAINWMPLLELNLAFNPDHLGVFFALLVDRMLFFPVFQPLF